MLFSFVFQVTGSNSGLQMEGRDSSTHFGRYKTWHLLEKYIKTRHVPKHKVQCHIHWRGNSRGHQCAFNYGALWSRNNALSLPKHVGGICCPPLFCIWHCTLCLGTCRLLIYFSNKRQVLHLRKWMLESHASICSYFMCSAVPNLLCATLSLFCSNSGLHLTILLYCLIIVKSSFQMRSVMFHDICVSYVSSC